MPHAAMAHELFFDRAGLDETAIRRAVTESLAGADDGELFLEYRQSETVVLDDRQIKSASFDTALGFGLRAVAGEAHGYAHGTELTEAAIRRAGETVKAVRSGRSGKHDQGPHRVTRPLYTSLNPLALVPFEDKVKLLEEIDAYARAKDSRARQVSASLSGSWQAVAILRADGALWPGGPFRAGTHVCGNRHRPDPVFG